MGEAMSKFNHPSCVDDAYHAIKRRGMRLRCLFGRHDCKMGVPARTGGGFGCLWCGAKARPTVHKSRGEVDKNKGSYSVDNGSKRQNSNETDPLLAYAERQVRRLFGGKL
jgi:hypothetical protein